MLHWPHCIYASIGDMLAGTPAYITQLLDVSGCKGFKLLVLCSASRAENLPKNTPRLGSRMHCTTIYNVYACIPFSFSWLDNVDPCQGFGSAFAYQLRAPTCMCKRVERELGSSAWLCTGSTFPSFLKECHLFQPCHKAADHSLKNKRCGIDQKRVFRTRG